MRTIDSSLREKILKCFGDAQSEDMGHVFACYDGKWLDITNDVESLLALFSSLLEHERREAEIALLQSRIKYLRLRLTHKKMFLGYDPDEYKGSRKVLASLKKRLSTLKSIKGDNK